MFVSRYKRCHVAEVEVTKPCPDNAKPFVICWPVKCPSKSLINYRPFGYICFFCAEPFKLFIDITFHKMQIIIMDKLKMMCLN